MSSKLAGIVLKLAVWLYWMMVPRRWRRRCLFHISCSQYVFRATDHGLVAGLVALKSRWRQCRGGYRALYAGDRWLIRLADGTLVHLDEMADWLQARCTGEIERAYSIALRKAIGSEDACAADGALREPSSAGSHRTSQQGER
jgi:putative component of membrane protein insertase Oxa1/YidC/SpoIIIJ protein YidD